MKTLEFLVRYNTYCILILFICFVDALQRKYYANRSGLCNIVYNPNCSIPTSDYEVLNDDGRADTLKTPLII